MLPKLFSIFATALLLNLVWEHAHSFLYTQYQGGAITEFILLRASLVDALIITAVVFPFIFFPALEKKNWLIIFFGVAIAIGIEMYALRTGRWSYNEYMPVLPWLSVGLTPTMQLGLLGYLTYWLVVGNEKNPRGTKS